MITQSELRLETPLREYSRGEHTITTDRSRFDLDVIHGYLSRSYWSPGMPRDIIERSMRSSYCFGVFKGNEQVGFARVVTDFATFAYLCDVFILETEQGHGLGKWLIDCIKQDPDLQGFRRWSLLTRDAHTLYEKYGFVRVRQPERHMEIADADIYKKNIGVAKKA